MGQAIRLGPEDLPMSDDAARQILLLVGNAIQRRGVIECRYTCTPGHFTLIEALELAEEICTIWDRLVRTVLGHLAGCEIPERILYLDPARCYKIEDGREDIVVELDFGEILGDLEELADG